MECDNKGSQKDHQRDPTLKNRHRSHEQAKQRYENEQLPQAESE
jgi:hypothetical protein